MTERTVTERNWSGNVTYRARRLHRPGTVEELQDVVAGAERVRPLGTRHSFNQIADTTGDLVSVERLRPPISIDHERRLATVPAGMRYGELAAALHAQGFALHNLGSLPHISVAGACATGTHGSGAANGNLATAVAGIEMVRADGELVRVARGHEDFGAAVLNLGALGVVTTLTLELRPTFEVRQDVYLDLPFTDLAAGFEEIMTSAYSVSLFTGLHGEKVDQVWVKHRVGADDEPAPPRLHGATLATSGQHPIRGQLPEGATQQLGVPGPWHERLPHFRLDFVPSRGDELQSEYLLPRTHAVDALSALRAVADETAPLLLVCEIRTVAADDLWLSPSRGQDVVAFHFTWVDDWPAVREVLPAVERALDPFAARPHWGKLFTTPPERVREAYERLPDFAALAGTYDPRGKLANPFLERYVR